MLKNWTSQIQNSWMYLEKVPLAINFFVGHYIQGIYKHYCHYYLSIIPNLNFYNKRYRLEDFKNITWYMWCPSSLLLIFFFYVHFFMSGYWTLMNLYRWHWQRGLDTTWLSTSWACRHCSSNLRAKRSGSSEEACFSGQSVQRSRRCWTRQGRSQ